jgi:hypothetical protein
LLVSVITVFGKGKAQGAVKEEDGINKNLKPIMKNCPPKRMLVVTQAKKLQQITLGLQRARWMCVTCYKRSAFLYFRLVQLHSVR